MAKYLYLMPLTVSAVFTIVWGELYFKFHDSAALIISGVGLFITLFMCFLAFVLENK